MNKKRVKIDYLMAGKRGEEPEEVKTDKAGAVPCGEGEGSALAYILLYGELIHGDGELGGDVHCQTGGVIPQCVALS